MADLKKKKKMVGKREKRTTERAFMKDTTRRLAAFSNPSFPILDAFLSGSVAAIPTDDDNCIAQKLAGKIMQLEHRIDDQRRDVDGRSRW